MIDIKDFTNEDGTTRWNDYKMAQIEAGEMCKTCGSYLLLAYPPRSSVSDCNDCKLLKNDTGNVTHDKLIRCPHCRHVFRVDLLDSDYSEEKYTDGDHEITCPSEECERDFKFNTMVSYSYESVAIVEGE